MLLFVEQKNFDLNDFHFVPLELISKSDYYCAKEFIDVPKSEEHLAISCLWLLQFSFVLLFSSLRGNISGIRGH